MSRVIIRDIKNKVIYVPLGDKFKKIVGHAMADLEDYDKIKNISFNRYSSHSGGHYAHANYNNSSIKMHILIFGKAPNGYMIDHINNNGLDNRKSNLRYATPSENAQNRIKTKNKYSSDYTGVHYNGNPNKPYRCSIQYNGKQNNIGSYSLEIDAAKAYDVYAIFYYGKDAKTNNTLSQDEINNILKNGIPREYKKPVLLFPKNISMMGEKYMCSVQRNGKRVYKHGINTLDEAIIIRDELIAKMDAEVKLENDTLESSKEITRNNNGDAVIYLRDKNGKIVSESIVDDHLWKTISQYSWYLANTGYVQGYPNSKQSHKSHQSLHRYLYKTYVGEIPSHLSIDHINREPLNNKLENLRLSTGTLQAHNQNKKIGSVCKYKGVYISHNKFVVNFFGQRHSFEYEEDAAKKYNELTKEQYGKDAYQNIITTDKTTVSDYAPKNITKEYINNIKNMVELKLLITHKEWGGPGGHFNSLKISKIEEYKQKAIQLLDNEEKNNGLNNVNKICNYLGVSMHGNKFIVNTLGQRSSFDYSEDAARRYNELAIERYGGKTKINVVPNTKTRIMDLIPDNITVEFIEQLKYATLLKQIIKKKGWGGGKTGHFSIRHITSKSFESDKEKVIKLLHLETINC